MSKEMSKEKASDGDDRQCTIFQKETLNLANYIMAYIETERERGNDVDEYVIANAIEAYQGGAR